MDQKYHEFIDDLVTEMGSRDLTVFFYRYIFNRIYYVAYYSKRLRESQTPEVAALARWSLDDAKEQLESAMNELCFDNSLREKIRYIARSPLSAIAL